MSRNLGALTLLDPSGPAWPVMRVLYLFFLTSTLNFKNRIYFTFCNTTYITTLQKAYSSWANNAMFSLKMV
jgi:hypothetical protein